MGGDLRRDDERHGRWRRRRVTAALLVQDAVPVGDSWLATLVAPLRRDERVAGTFARQVPRADASAIAREYLLRAPVASAIPRTLRPLTPGEIAQLDPMARLTHCS